MPVYQSKNLSPNGTAVDFSTNQTFTANVQGTRITDYRLIIKRVDNNSTLYDSTKLASTPNLFNNDLFSHTITGGTLSYLGSVKWTLQTFSGADSATTREIPFYSASTPVATLSISSPVNAKSINLTTSYTQAQNIPVQKYIYYLYDNNNVEIENSGEIFSGALTHTFDGFVDEVSYKAECIITDIYGTETTTGKISFTVDYSEPVLGIVPSAIVNDDSTVSTMWTEAIQISGTITGTSSYVENFIKFGNTALQLNSGADVEWTVDIPELFTANIIFQPNGFTNGIIILFEGDDGDLEIGYDGTRFYFKADGNTINGIPLALNSAQYLIGVRYNEVVIVQNNVILDYLKLF